MTFERQSWLAVAKRFERKNSVIVPERGNIYSDNGQLISATLPYYTLFMDTKVDALHQKGGKLYKENIDSLCHYMSVKFKDKTPKQYRKMFDDAYLHGNRRLKIYPKKVSYIDMEEVKQFPLFKLGRYKSGFYVEEYANRENLYGTLASRTVGDIFGNGQGGQYGLELFYDSLLAGEPGEARSINSTGKWVKVPVVEPKNGCDLVTTLNMDMQDICETTLRKKLIQIGAKSGCLILMEVKTGQIKAMVNLGRTSQGGYAETLNMAVSDLSEPGSTFKTLSFMIALEDGMCDTSDVLNINHGRWNFGSAVMTDHNWRRGGYDSLSVSDIMAFSSNVGTSRVIDEHYSKNPSDFVDAIIKSGFTDDLNIEITGAAKPRIPHPKTSKNWSRTSLPWMSIGYGVQVPPIYTLNYYNAIANDGKLMRPYLVRRIEEDGRVVKEIKPEVVNSSICSNSTLRKLRKMLEGVVEYGTAKPNKSTNFKIAGKTGTAQLGYGKRSNVVKHQVSFCGYFPADKPLYSCIVVVKEPQMPPAAAFMCGAVFKEVAEKVFAQSVDLELERLPRWEGDSIDCVNLPRVKAGRSDLVEEALDKLDLDYEREKCDWIAYVPSCEEQELQGKKRPVLDNLVPNVVGMGASDALYLMEKAGLRVTIYGKGRVVRQSLSPGINASRGAMVTLYLR